MNTASTILFVYFCKSEERKSRNYWFGGEDDTIAFNLKWFQNFCRNPIAAEEHSKKADLAYGSSSEVGQNQIAFANLINFLLNYCIPRGGEEWLDFFKHLFG